MIIVMIFFTLMALLHPFAKLIMLHYDIIIMTTIYDHNQQISLLCSLSFAMEHK